MHTQCSSRVLLVLVIHFSGSLSHSINALRRIHITPPSPLNFAFSFDFEVELCTQKEKKNIKKKRRRHKKVEEEEVSK